MSPGSMMGEGMMSGMMNMTGMSGDMGGMMEHCGQMMQAMDDGHAWRPNDQWRQPQPEQPGRPRDQVEHPAAGAGGNSGWRPEGQEMRSRKLLGVSLVTHVIDRGGRWQANFHGLEFDPTNLVLYVNALTNAHGPEGHPEPGWWDKMRSLF